MQFEEKTVIQAVEGVEVEIWVNPPRGPFEAEGRKGDLHLLAYTLKRWDIGGKEYHGFKFPPSPNLEALGYLPVDIVGKLVRAVGAAIADTIPKPNTKR